MTSNPSRSTKNTIFWIDLAKTIAILMVVGIHASADLFYEFGNIPMQHWWASNFYQSFSRISVPFFFMVSGLLLLGKYESLGFFFNRRVLKIFLPLIFWSFFFLVWRIYFFKEPLNFFIELAKLLEDPAFPHLWFLYAILGVYLSYPVIRVVIQNGKPSVLWYFIMIWLVCLTVLPSLEAYSGLTINTDLISNLGLFFGYLGYTVIGYLLGTSPRNNRILAAMIPIAIISPFATLLRTFISTDAAGSINEYFYHYLSPNVILAAISSFYLLRFSVLSLESRISQKAKLFIASLSKNSFSIYLIHPIFIQLLAAGTLGFRLSAFTGNPWFTIPAVTFLSIVLSFIAVFLLKKISILRKILP